MKLCKLYLLFTLLISCLFFASCSSTSALKYHAMGINFKVKDEDMVLNKFYVDHSDDGKVSVARIKVKGTTFEDSVRDVITGIGYNINNKLKNMLGQGSSPDIICYFSLKDDKCNVLFKYEGSPKLELNEKLLKEYAAGRRDGTTYDQHKSATLVHEKQHIDDIMDYKEVSPAFVLSEKVKNDMIKQMEKASRSEKDMARREMINNNIKELEKKFNGYEFNYYKYCRVGMEVRAMRAEEEFICDNEWIEKKRKIGWREKWKGLKEAQIPNPIYKDQNSVAGLMTYLDAYKAFSQYYKNEEFENGLKLTQDILAEIGYYYLKSLNKEEAKIQKDKITTNLWKEKLQRKGLEVVTVATVMAAVYQASKKSKKQAPAAQQSGSKYCWCGKSIGHLSNHAKKQ